MSRQLLLIKKRIYHVGRGKEGRLVRRKSKYEISNFRRLYAGPQDLIDSQANEK